MIFCGAECQHGLGWVVIAWGFLNSCQMLAGAAAIWRPNWAGRLRWGIDVAGSKCWLFTGSSVGLDTGVPICALLHCVGFSQPGGWVPRVYVLRGGIHRASNLDRSCKASFDLALEVPQPDLYHIRFVTSKSLRPAQIPGNGNCAHL